MQELELDLSRLEELTRCPICFDVCRDTRTVMVCLHRFCGNCIEASLRQNKNE